MRAQDIVIGETYRHRDHPKYGYAKAVKIIRPRPKCQQRLYDYTEEEKTAKTVLVKCEWTLDKDDSFGLIKYFKPSDLVDVRRRRG